MPGYFKSRNEFAKCYLITWLLTGIFLLFSHQAVAATSHKHAVLNYFQDGYNGKQKRKFLVAIDSGHGGRDYGAVGPSGVVEKKIVLKVAKQIHNIFKHDSSIDTYLLRDSDKYLSIRDRITKTRLYRADLLVSIHADAFWDKSISGASVLTHSHTASTNTVSAWLARRETVTDKASSLNLTAKNPVIASTLVDMARFKTKTASTQAANCIVHSLQQVVKLRTKSIESAKFLILMAPDVPAVLVETGFISNPKEEKLLARKDYQTKVAKAIASGIRRYVKQVS